VDLFERVRQIAREHGHHQSYGGAWLPDLVEAYLRDGRGEDAEVLLAGVPKWRPRDALVWGAAAGPRCRGLLADALAFAAHFDRALAFTLERTTRSSARGRSSARASDCVGHVAGRRHDRTSARRI
jgi:hypothetical protein